MGCNLRVLPSLKKCKGDVWSGLFDGFGGFWGRLVFLVVLMGCLFWSVCLLFGDRRMAGMIGL